MFWAFELSVFVLFLYWFLLTLTSDLETLTTLSFKTCLLSLFSLFLGVLFLVEDCVVLSIWLLKLLVWESSSCNEMSWSMISMGVLAYIPGDEGIICIVFIYLSPSDNLANKVSVVPISTEFLDFIIFLFCNFKSALCLLCGSISEFCY